MSTENKIKELGLSLPTPAVSVANYVAYVITGNLVSISGQLPMGPDGPAFIGKIGVNVSEDEAVEAAKLCALNILAQLKLALNGDLERVVRIVRLGGFVNCVDGFQAQPAIINGASDLMVAIFGEKGRHSRAAVGVNALPFNVPVEIDALIEIK